MQSVVERYMRSCSPSESPDNVINNNASSSEQGSTDRVTQFTDKMKSLQSTFIGDDFERLSSRDLIRLEQQIHDSLGRIRAKKEELFLEQLQEIKDKIASARKAVNGNSDVLEKIVEFTSTDFTGYEDIGAEAHNRRSIDGATLLDVSRFPGNSDTSNQAVEGVPVAKRARMTEDLNKSPPLCEEWSRD
ncbi:hypothetical protein L7F22_026810 [Adiantum nelumboides]|nr:hypothetical protein [Adiantum nelumboides]